MTCLPLEAQSQVRGNHREHRILIERVGLRAIAFLIRRPDGKEFASGYTDEPCSCRQFAQEIALWLDSELRMLEAIA